MQRRPRADRIDAALDAFLIDVHDQIEPEPFRRLVAKRDHLAEFPPRIDVEEREGRLCRIKRLPRQVQQNARILADRIHQHGVAKFGRDLAQDRNRFRFETLQVRSRVRPAGQRCRLTARPRFEGLRPRHRIAMPGSPSRQCQTHIVEQGFFAERLRHIRQNPFRKRLVSAARGRAAGDQDRRYAVSRRHQPMVQRQPAHLRHFNIRDQASHLRQPVRSQKLLARSEHRCL